MLCRKCGGANRDDQRFCGQCGASLELTCEHCGGVLTITQRFCGDCGRTTGAPDAAADLSLIERNQPIAERRRCSVLFVDLVDYTSFAEHRDPEEVRELLSSYFDATQSIIARFGGTVEKFIGDAVMAVWGAPVANEDDAERAVRAGLEVLEAVGVVGTAAGLVLRARAGIVTGESAVTVGKVAEGMVLGDAVNAAARVQVMADADTLFVDRATWSAASEAIVFEAIGERSVKGRSEPIEVWRALRVVSQRRGLGRTERLEPPFVGRDDELRLIRELLHLTTREGRARLVSVTGVPGIGKSRLTWEFLKYIDGLAEDVYWHQGQSAAFGETTSFGALAEMVRERAGIVEIDPPEVARQKLRDSVEVFVKDEEERDWINARLAHLLGLADLTGAESGELFSAWRAFFEHVSRAGVTVMVFEDLQWADSGLVEFVESMLEWSRDFPIMIVTLSRPEFFDQRSSWGAGQPRFVSVHLESLDDTAMRELIEGFVIGLPDRGLAQILERAEGVPLYAVEMVRMLVDRGTLVEHEGAYRVEGEVVELETPGTLQALVASRLDALTPELRALVQDASVIGAFFLPATLAAVSGLDRARIDVDLRELVHREFLRFDSDPRSPERGQYGFVQSVIAEVARSMLARRELSTKHQTLARYYESMGDDDLIEVVASHYFAAFQSAHQSEGSVLAANARSWLHRAGERARSLGSLEQALDLVDAALAIEVPGSDRRPLLHLAFEMSMDRSEFVRARELLQDLTEEDDRVEDVRARARTAMKHCALLRETDEPNEAARVAVKGYDELNEVDAPRERAELAIHVARSLSLAARNDEALPWTDRALTFAERVQSPLLFALALRVRAIVLEHLSRTREAELLVRGSTAFAEVAESTRARLLANDALASIILTDDPYSAYQTYQENIELTRRGGQRRLEEYSIVGAIELAIRLGRWSEADTFFEVLRPRTLDVLRVSRELLESQLTALREGVVTHATTRTDDAAVLEGVVPHEVAEHINRRALTCYGLGDFENARTLVATALELATASCVRAPGIVLSFRSEVELRNVEGVARCLAAAEMLWGRWMAAACLEMRAALAGLEGSAEESRGLFRSAIESYRELHCTLDVAICEYEEVFLLGVTNCDPAHAHEAEEIFLNLEARVFLGRLQSARESQGELVRTVGPLAQ